MSPRSTHALNEVRDLKHLAPVALVCLKRRHLGGYCGPPPESAGAVEDRFADRVGSAQTCRLKLGQRSQGLRIEADADG